MEVQPAALDESIYMIDGHAASGTSIIYFDFKTRKSRPVITTEHLSIDQFPAITASKDGRLLIFSQFEASSRINLAEIAD